MNSYESSVASEFSKALQVVLEGIGKPEWVVGVDIDVAEQSYRVNYHIKLTIQEQGYEWRYTDTYYAARSTDRSLYDLAYMMWLTCTRRRERYFVEHSTS